MFGSALGIMAAHPKGREALRGLGDRMAQGMRGPTAPATPATPAPTGAPPQGGGGMPGGGVFSGMRTRRRPNPSVFSAFFGGIR